MSDPDDVITLDSDDESDSNPSGADLIVGPTGTAVPAPLAVRQGIRNLPLPAG